MASASVCFQCGYAGSEYESCRPLAQAPLAPTAALHFTEKSSMARFPGRTIAARLPLPATTILWQVLSTSLYPEHVLLALHDSSHWLKVVAPASCCHSMLAFGTPSVTQLVDGSAGVHLRSGTGVQVSGGHLLHHAWLNLPSVDSKAVARLTKLPPVQGRGSTTRRVPLTGVVSHLISAEARTATFLYLTTTVPPLLGLLQSELDVSSVQPSGLNSRRWKTKPCSLHCFPSPRLPPCPWQIREHSCTRSSSVAAVKSNLDCSSVALLHLTSATNCG